MWRQNMTIAIIIAIMSKHNIRYQYFSLCPEPVMMTGKKDGEHFVSRSECFQIIKSCRKVVVLLLQFLDAPIGIPFTDRPSLSSNLRSEAKQTEDNA